MTEGGEEVSDTITLRVKDQTGDEMFFKVKLLFYFPPTPPHTIFYNFQQYLFRLKKRLK
jgi:hypothetical protein